MFFKFMQRHISKLKNLGVGIVYLFGSRAAETYTKNSDIDIGIVF